MILMLLMAWVAMPVDIHRYMLDRLNRFNADMRDFTNVLRAGFFNPAGQKSRLSKEWREVESSGDWPRYQGGGCQQ